MVEMRLDPLRLVELIDAESVLRETENLGPEQSAAACQDEAVEV